MPEPVENTHRYMPGLDGLRAVAVLVVIAYHLEFGWAQGGLLGVGVFFTLSGYLITDILLEQYAALGRIPLKDFWLRRARRLLPALFLMLAVVSVWVALLDPSRLAALRADVIAAVLYVSNWWYIFQDVSYFENFGPPPPLGHLWSLAVEEQFYVVWPLLLLLALRFIRRRWLLVGLTVLASVLSAALMAYLYEPGLDPTRVYDGTDTRAFGLLLGAALAMVWSSRSLGREVRPTETHPSETRRSRRLHHRGRRIILDCAGIVGLVSIALLVWLTSEFSPFIYRGGLVVLSIATVMVVAALAHPGTFTGRALGVAPLRWVGVRSYGIYLWHFPIIALTTQSPQRNLLVDALQVTATIAVAALSWRFFEEPIRRGAIERLWNRLRSGGWRTSFPVRGLAASVGTAAVTVLAVVSLAGAMPAIVSGNDAGDAPPPPGEAEIVINTPAEKTTDPYTMQEVALSESEPSEATAPESTNPEGTTPESTAPEETAPEETTPEDEPVAEPLTSCPAVAYIGDSTSEGMMSPDYLIDPTLRLDAQYARVGVTSQAFDISGARSIVETLPGQTSGEEAAQAIAASGFSGCWMIALGGNDAANVSIGSQYGAENRIERMMSVADGEPVLWVNTKTLLFSTPYDNANMEIWNSALEQACAEYPNMRVYDWASAVQDSWFIDDGTHFTSEGYAWRARLSADALARAFPATESEEPGCLVR